MAMNFLACDREQAFLMPPDPRDWLPEGHLAWFVLPDPAPPRWRSTNLLERSLGEVKRPRKVIGRFPGEDSCLTLVWAVLDLYITHETNGVRFTQLDRQRLNRIRYEEPEQAIPEEVSAA